MTDELLIEEEELDLFGLPELDPDDPAKIPEDQGDVGKIEDQSDLGDFFRDGLASIAATAARAPQHHHVRFTAEERRRARGVILSGARLCIAHRGAIHYTQGPRRWEGIVTHDRIVRGRYPHFADCSAMSTWLLWNAMTHAKRTLRLPDHVNYERWRAGYTGSMAQHGKHLDHPKFIGDQLLYGSGWPYHHVTTYLGGGMCFSHGSEGGPYILPIHYRDDLSAIRRYILAP